MSTEELKIYEDTLREVYDKICEMPNKVYNIIKDFFGEERVDMQYLTFEEFKRLENTLLADMSNINHPLHLNCTLKRYANSHFEEATKFLKEEETAKRLAIMLGSFNILIHFPHVAVTNENNNFTEIDDLFVKFTINNEGKLSSWFKLNRATYSLTHIREGYMHSHVNCIPFSNFGSFQSPCLGRGPLISTQNSLEDCYDEDLWNLFCFELDKYVRTESLEGGPYHRLESLSNSSLTPIFSLNYPYLQYKRAFNNIIYYKIKNSFIKYLINKKILKFNFINGTYSIAMSALDCALLFSNTFIEWVNSEGMPMYKTLNLSTLINTDIIYKGIIKDGKLYRKTESNNYNHYKKFIGEKVCTFKGKDVTIKLIDDSEEETFTLHFLNPHIINAVLNEILRILNYKYGKNSEFGKKIAYI